MYVCTCKIIAHALMAKFRRIQQVGNLLKTWLGTSRGQVTYKSKAGFQQVGAFVKLETCSKQVLSRFPTCWIRWNLAITKQILNKNLTWCMRVSYVTRRLANTIIIFFSTTKNRLFSKISGALSIFFYTYVYQIPQRILIQPFY